MLLEFSVSNFLSFRERQTFSMTAVPRLKKKNCVFPAPVDGEKLPELLKVAVMYGPNASGKSNFLMALQLINLIASRPADRTGSLPVNPFRFDRLLHDEPSTFEVHFLAGRRRYEFLLAVTRDRVVRERLTAYPKGEETLLYDRHHVDGVDVYDTSGLEGGDTVHEAWKRLTPPRALFISQAVASSNEEMVQLRSPHAWLTSALFSFGSTNVSNIAERSLRLARDTGNGTINAEIAAFLSDVDVPVVKIRVLLPEPESESTPESVQSNALARLGLNELPRPKPPARKGAVFTHRTALGEAEFLFDEESEGTRNLIGFWLPWSTRDPAVYSNRCILAVDEMDSSLHPSIVANLVKKHLEDETPSQLIFTTHDTHLMDSGLLRRDQFWIAERNMDGATELRSIHDFAGREGEDIEKRYYEGRYRGLPLVRG